MAPIIKAVDVQYCTLQCPDLDIQEQFLIHFGMHTVSKTEEMLLMKGDGSQFKIPIDFYRRVWTIQLKKKINIKIRK